MNEGHLAYCASPEWRKIVEETILPHVLRNVELGSDVIEIGPGPGFTTDVLRTLTERLTAVEVDPVLAGPLAHRLQGTNVTVVRGDATALDLEDDRFTGAASFHMLHHLESAGAQDRAFAELARVLRPGGVLVAADGVENEGSRAFHEGDIYNPIDPDGLAQRLADAGFSAASVGVTTLGWYCTARA